MAMHQAQGIKIGTMVSGSRVLELVPDDCVQNCRLREILTSAAWIYQVYQQWPLVALSVLWKLQMAGSRSPSSNISLENLLNILHPCSSPTAGMDCFVLCLIKRMGLAGLHFLVHPLRVHVTNSPKKRLRHFHLTAFKSPGPDMNLNTRAIKLMSALTVCKRNCKLWPCQ